MGKYIKKVFVWLWEEIQDFLYKAYAFVKSGIFLSFLIFIGLEYFVFSFFIELNTDVNIIAGSMTGLGIIFGYFITHYLEIIRKQQEKKFDQYCELLKALRIFIAETNLEEHERKELVNKFQLAYFGSTIFISKNAYEKIKDVARLYSNYQSNINPDNLAIFRKAQSNFINCLRNEFFHEKDLDFLAYDIRWKEQINQRS